MLSVRAPFCLHPLRIDDDELNEFLPALPALSLEGTKGVGKTETALQRARTVYRLDDPATPWDRTPRRSRASSGGASQE